MKKTLKITLITLVTTILACSTYKPKQLVQSESHNSVIISESDYNLFTINKNVKRTRTQSQKSKKELQSFTKNKIENLHIFLPVKGEIENYEPSGRFDFCLYKRPPETYGCISKE